MLRSAVEPPLSSAPSASRAAERADIPDCVLSELWARRSDAGVGSPLIDIYTETDYSSQASDDEGPADRLTALPGAVSELIEVVEDDDFGTISEGGGLIWVVENDVSDLDGSETSSRSTGLPSGEDVDCAIVAGPMTSPIRSGERCRTAWNGRPRTPQTPKKHKLATKGGYNRGPKADCDRGSACQSRAAKSPRKSPTCKESTHRVATVSTAASGTPPRALTSVSVQLSRLLTGGEGPSSVPAPAAAPTDAEPGGVTVEPTEFPGFPAECGAVARARWLRHLAAVAAEERESGDVSPADAALLRLRELANSAAAAAAVPARTATQRSSQSDGEPAAAAATQLPSSVGPTVPEEPPEQPRVIELPTYVSLMPESEKERFKGSFLSMFSLRHIDNPPPPALRLSRTIRQRLRKRKPIPEETPEKPESSPLPPRAGPGSLLAAARRPSALPAGLRAKALRRPGGGALRRGLLEERAAAGDSSGDEAAAAVAAERRRQRGRRRLLDFSELVEVEGVLDLADTYSGCEEPPPLVPETPPAEREPPTESPPPAPPELPPQRWPRADAARCRVCRKFIARVLLPLHLRLHRTGYRGCDVCGQVLESAAALYRHRLGHEPARFCCLRCGRQFDTAAKLERHRASAHALLCARCGASVPTPELVHNHDCDQPPPEPATAARPVAVPAAPPADRGRDRPADGQEPLACPECNRLFLLRDDLSMHMKTEHDRGEPEPVGSGDDGGDCPTATTEDCSDVLSCRGDIFGTDLYNEILSVV
ncbi:Ras-responsive element-binding protein 1 [Amphibalanus amphitrite]|uniref:Ras-responsive element-binding protein 1 n=1 Tax=Amphibalanus amphitrite TaxID=1232801 RepID=A0A6A4VAV5_AMPAM|nr:Ras-responsive element-binding protein 1 [Amphibalanus amphitrite]